MTVSPSDLDLLDRWRNGDRAAGSALYQRYAAPITTYFRRNVSDRNQIEELVQETFLTCLRSQQPIENFRACLYGMAFHSFTRYLRAKGRLPAIDHDFEDIAQCTADIIPDPEYVRGQREDRRLLIRALRRIPYPQQVVLELSVFEDLAGAEIAQILGRPEGTVRSRLRLGKENLQAQLAALADSPEVLRDTTTGLDTWRRGILAYLGRDGGASAEVS